MILFFLSLIIICMSSWLVTSVFAPKRCPSIGIIYFLVAAFAQVVLAFEVLSIFSSISPMWVILLNVIFLISSILFWNKKGRPLYKPEIERGFISIKNALIKDKALLVLGLAFAFFIFVTLILCIFVPVNSYDALTYHLARVPFWIEQGNLSHFLYPDTRINVMPINSELLYTWVLVFLKSDWFLGLFSFLGYFLAVISLYGFLGALGFCQRKRLWSVFIFSSLASIVVEASSTETEVIIGGLILASIFLYFYGVKKEQNVPIYFSSLAYALAVGTKTPAIMAIPACFILFCVMSYLYKKNDFYKPILEFSKFFIINFILFASYNYILNFINYGNFLSNQSQLLIHSFFGGIKGFVANFIRYVCLLFDSSGFRYADYIGKYVTQFQHYIFDILKIPHDLGVIVPSQYGMNKNLLESIMGCGLLGFVIFIPMLFYSMFKGIKYRFSKRSVILSVIAVIFFINLIVLSFSMGFMIFNVRFVTFFVILSAPVLVYSYMKNNNIFKYIVMFFAMSYMMIISTHILARPFFKLIHFYKIDKSITALRERMVCSETVGFDGKMPICLIKDVLEKAPDKKNIAVFPDSSFRIYPLKMMEHRGWDLDILLLEDLEKYNMDKYDFILIMNKIQRSENILHIEERINDYYLKDGDIYFTKKRLVNCIYTDKDNFPVDAESARKASSSVCYVPDGYFKQVKFKPFTKIIIEGKSAESIKNILIYKK